MTRLTKAIRDKFVNDVMADVPRVDLRQQAQDLVQNFQFEHMPEDVRRVFANVTNRKWLKFDRYSVAWLDSYIPICGEYPRGDEINRKLDALRQQQKEENLRVKTLREALSLAAGRVSTLKGLRDKFPELAKYIPKDSEVPAPELSDADIVGQLADAGRKADKK